MEVSFAKEVESLRLGDGQVFYGEGILAVTKALLQSGVAYVGGYQGAPVSHLLDVMVQSQDLLDELGIHLETCTNEASAAAMLGASINYPLRGAVTWKSIVGTNVASDALSNLASAGVMGGALIVVGEDYGEGASVIQERSHAYALKSGIWLLDPRPDLPTIVRMVETAFELSEASNTPVMMELRIRACHVFGSFEAKDNVKPARSRSARFEGPPKFEYERLSHPPATFRQEQDKLKRRLPAARAFILEHGLNELMGEEGRHGDVGIILQGGLSNAVLRQLEELGLADTYGASEVPLLVLNVTHPLVPSQITQFCAGKSAVLVVEEGQPDYIEQAVGQILRKADLPTRLHGKDLLAEAGEYTAPVVLAGLAAFARAGCIEIRAPEDLVDRVAEARRTAAEILGEILPARPPTFCTGCPERPVFSAIKLLQRDVGPVHISADIGCHALATFAPFHSGNSILGYGMSLASAAAVSGTQAKRPISVMGDGGFWHNGLVSGVASAVFNRDDSILVVMQNGYSSATGIQDLPSSAGSRHGAGARLSIEQALKTMGVKWVRTVRTYGVAGVLKTLKEAMNSKEPGLKAIVADGECQLARQRRIRPENAARLKAGERVVRTRFGIDDDVCTGDHSCIRLSGCPSLTIKPTTDPLRTDPIAHVNNDCVGCGLCGEVAHAAQLCPSFYRAEIVQNPGWWDRLLWRVRARVIGWLQERPAPEVTAPGATIHPEPAE